MTPSADTYKWVTLCITLLLLQNENIDTFQMHEFAPLPRPQGGQALLFNLFPLVSLSTTDRMVCSSSAQ